jgi:hypothetical protein
MDLSKHMTVSSRGSEDALPIFESEECNALSPGDQLRFLIEKLPSLLDPSETHGFFRPEAYAVLSAPFRTSFIKWYDLYHRMVVKWGAMIIYAGILLKLDDCSDAGKPIKATESILIPRGFKKPLENIVNVSYLGATGYADAQVKVLTACASFIHPGYTYLVRLGKSTYQQLLLRQAFDPSPVQVASNSLLYNVGPGIYFTNCISYLSKVLLKMLLEDRTPFKDLSLLVLQVPSPWIKEHQFIGRFDVSQTVQIVKSSLKWLNFEHSREYMAVQTDGICKNTVQVSRCHDVVFFSCADTRCLCLGKGFELCIRSGIIGLQLFQVAQIYLIHL